MSYEKLTLISNGPVTTLTLNRPESHNALDRQLSDELNDALRSVQRDRDCRILVLTGAGGTFCAGDDIKEFMDWKFDDVQRVGGQILNKTRIQLQPVTRHFQDLGDDVEDSTSGIERGDWILEDHLDLWSESS